MKPTEKQVGYLIWSLRPYKKFLIERRELIDAPNGSAVWVNRVWEDLQEWIEEHISKATASEIISKFKEDEDAGFELMKKLGMPVLVDK